MIFYIQVPDVANGKDNTGNVVPLGTIDGKGVIVPATSCPLHDGGDRTPISKCFSCMHYKTEHFHYIECEYQEPKAKIKIVPDKPLSHGEITSEVQKGTNPKSPSVKRKEPDGVFNKKDK